MVARYCIVLILYWGITLEVSPQSLVVSGSFRPRAEYRDGYASPIESIKDPAGFVVQRTRLGIGFEQSSIQAKLTLQDARTYGEASIASQAASGQSTLGVYEAWMQMSLSPYLCFKLGRQTLSYDDNRLFSDSNWNNTGSAHDMLLCTYQQKESQIHLGLAYNNNSSELSESYYKPGMKYRYLGYLRFQTSFNQKIGVSAMAVDEGVQVLTDGKYGAKCSMDHAYTFGGNLKLDLPSFSALATFYSQAGTTVGAQQLSSSLLAANATYNFNPKVRMKAGCDYFQGAATKQANVYASFKKLYGTEHAFNGAMDYWSVLPYQGLLNYYGGTALKFYKQLEIECMFHLFRSGSAVISEGRPNGKSLGTEIDLSLSYKINKWSNLKGGWSCYFTTANTFAAKGMPQGDYRFPQWAFVMLSVSPEYILSMAEKK